MATLSIAAFAGAMPKLSPRLLENQNAVEAVNCDIGSGSLRALRAPAQVQALEQAAAAIFKHPVDGWLSWERPVSVVKSAIADAEGEKPLGQLLLTGDREYPTMYLAGGEVHRLGIPRPASAVQVDAVPGAQLLNAEGRAWAASHISAAPARYGDEGLELCGILQDGGSAEIAVLSRAAFSGEEDGEDAGTDGEDEATGDDVTDSGIQRSTAYCYTYVQCLADGVIRYESAPSPASDVIDVQDDAGVTLSGFVLPELDGLTVTHIRLYRTVSGTESSEFRLLAELSVEELAAAGWTYLDAAHDMNVSAEVLQTATWDPIPDNARGLIKTDNGLYACFHGNELCVSEPFIPYAYPAAYRLLVEDSIVALAHMTSTIVILTTGRPYLAQGDVPESLQLVHLPIEQACVSARSVAAMSGGVIYASPDGLMLFTSSDQSLVSQQTLSREQWQALGPERLLGAIHDGRYVGFFEGGNRGILFHLGRADFVTLELPQDWKVRALYQHSVDDALYLSVERPEGCAILQFEAGEDVLPYRWRSKHFFSPALVGMSAARVVGEQGPRAPVRLSVYAGSAARLGERPRAVLHLTDDRTKRLPVTRAERLWCVELSGTAEVHECRIGGSVEGVEHG